MQATIATPRHSTYHDRHLYEMMGALRELRFEVLQAQKHLDRDRVASGNTHSIGLQSVAAGRDARALSNARSSLENAIVALSEKEYRGVYEPLDHAASELEFTPYDSLGDSIREWRGKWLPNKSLNRGRV